MKLLLVGPYPPPHGGVSVHVRSLRELMDRKGIQCQVLNADPKAPMSQRYIKINGGLDFMTQLFRHSWDGWTIHVHTNGHNRKSWLVALAAAVAGVGGRGSLLTLHSGILPAYLAPGRGLRAFLAAATCRLYDRIICVNDEIRDTLVRIGVAKEKLEVKEAYLAAAPPQAEAPPQLAAWARTRSPLLTTTMFMRPEYGYEVLTAAVGKLKDRYPDIGCVVMGVAGKSADDAVWHAGDVDHDVCLSVISRSDAFIRPTFQDGDSISVREAHALGIPVIASNVGMRPAGTILFKPGDVEGLVNAIQNTMPSRGKRPAGGQHENHIEYEVETSAANVE